jgi:RimJ/RimL family protein N-acetyltransferase
MAWRSNPLVYEGFYTQREPLTWEEHFTWWNTNGKQRKQYMIIYNGRKVGTLAIAQLDHWTPEIGYMIGEVSLWGHGVAKEAVRQSCEMLKSWGYKYTHTTVLESNTRSVKLLESLGFKKLGEARKGEIWVTKEL